MRSGRAGDAKFPGRAFRALGTVQFDRNGIIRAISGYSGEQPFAHMNLYLEETRPALHHKKDGGRAARRPPYSPR